MDFGVMDPPETISAPDSCLALLFLSLQRLDLTTFFLSYTNKYTVWTQDVAITNNSCINFTENQTMLTNSIFHDRLHTSRVIREDQFWSVQRWYFSQ